MKDIIRLLEEKRRKAQEGGGKNRIDAQHKKGKLTKEDFKQFEFLGEKYLATSAEEKGNIIFSHKKNV